MLKRVSSITRRRHLFAPKLGTRQPINLGAGVGVLGRVRLRSPPTERLRTPRGTKFRQSATRKGGESRCGGDESEENVEMQVHGLVGSRGQDGFRLRYAVYRTYIALWRMQSLELRLNLRPG
jgi:hypothetical protein